MEPLNLVATIREHEKKSEKNFPALTPLGLGPWSYSKVKLLRSCPLQFYLKYILKVKVPAAPVSVITEVGKAAHRVMELAPSGRAVSELLLEVRPEFKVLSDEEWKLVEELEFNIMAFQQRLKTFELKHGVTKYLHELRIGVTKDWTPTGFFADDVYYRGVIDFTVLLENKDALFIDHKTGAPAIMGTRNFQEQLNVYKVLFHHGVAKIRGAKSGIHFIRDGEVKMADYHDMDEIEGKLRHNVSSSIEVVIDMLHDYGRFKKTPGVTHCKYCDYAKECKSKQLVEVETQTVRFFKNVSNDKKPT